MNPDRQQPVRNSADVFQNLLRLPAKGRLIAGLIAFTGGTGLTVYFWERGAIWGLLIFASVGGFALTISGLLGLKEEARRRKKEESIRERVPELLAGMEEAKRQGKNVVRWLNEQGVDDIEIRTKLIEVLNQRVKSAGARGGAKPESAPGKSA